MGGRREGCWWLSYQPHPGEAHRGFLETSSSLGFCVGAILGREGADRRTKGKNERKEEWRNWAKKEEEEKGEVT